MKLSNVEHQLETAKAEVNRPFAQEAELSEKLDRLTALNALLNVDEKGMMRLEWTRKQNRKENLQTDQQNGLH